jgi:hypothetical protein
MLTIHAVPPEVPVLVGRLVMHRLGRIKGRPVLSCSIWCPWCRDDHAVEFPEPPFGLECVTPLQAPCRSGPFVGATVMVGLDPERQAEHGELVRHFSQSLRRWRSEQKFRAEMFEARAIDRKHVAEWGVLPSVLGS